MSSFLDSLAWLGLYASLNQTALVREPMRPNIAAEATAIVGIGKLTLTAIYIQPLQTPKAPVVSFGIGIRVF